VSRFRLADLAKSDLATIRHYIARDNPSAADRQIDRFFETFHRLGRNPGMGERRPDLGEELRTFSVGTYVIVFRPAPEGVRIVRVVSGYRDMEALF
jgi:toxin ParE1/3/4